MNDTQDMELKNTLSTNDTEDSKVSVSSFSSLPTEPATKSYEGGSFNANEILNECSNNLSEKTQPTDAVDNISIEGQQNKHSRKTKNKRNKGKLATIYITKIAILSSLSTVLYFFARFPIFPVFPFNVLEMDFSSIPSLLGAFALGPLAGVIIELIKCSIKLLTSTSLLVGELSNFIVSSSLVLPAAIVYKYKKGIKGAVLGLILGIVMNLVISSLSNYFFILPLYAKLFSPALIDYRIDFSFKYGLAFNAIKSVSTSIITFFLYKRVSKLLHL